MRENKELKKPLPPYLPYRTFLNLEDRLKASITPARIDRSVVSSFSGAIQSQIFLTLKYLGLINENGVPSELLDKLLKAKDDTRQKILNDIVVASYPFLFVANLDLKKLTADQLLDIFNKEGCSGETTRKAMAFFTAIAKEAGMELSPYLKRLKSRGSRGTGSKIKKEGEEVQKAGSSNNQPAHTLLTSNQGWQQQVLSKIPDFNPGWDVEERKAWYEMMSRLIDDFKKQSIPPEG
jgi:gas vesicle protein